MRYKVHGLEIRSENAAKPATQAAAFLVSWLEEQKNVKRALDFGCGKLRYSEILYSKANLLTLVDSSIQLCRTQTLRGETTTVYEYAKKHWPKARVLNTENFKGDRMNYEFVLCANVLSTIPDAKVRSEVMKQIRFKLGRNGKCLFVTQFRSSYFSSIANSKEACPYLDGWILRWIRLFRVEKG